MKKVILVIGPRGAGKSAYCQKIISDNPRIHYLSRDKLFDDWFGADWGNPYYGYFEFGMIKLWQEVSNCFQAQEAVVLFDCWSGYPWERSNMVDKLFDLGAEQVVGWHFITPLDTCISWFVKREIQRKQLTGGSMIDFYADCCRRDYKLFYELLGNLQEQGFSTVRCVDPLQAEIFPYIIT